MKNLAHHNATLASAVNQFLQDVWNEAVVTNRKDIDSINEIAWQHLGGDTLTIRETCVPAAKCQTPL